MGHQAELGGQHDLVAAALQRLSHEFLVDVGAVDFGGVDERHPEVECAVDGADRFGVVAAGAGVAVRHAHRPQADARYRQVLELDVLHVTPPVSGLADVPSVLRLWVRYTQETV